MSVVENDPFERVFTTLYEEKTSSKQGGWKVQNTFESDVVTIDSYAVLRQSSPSCPSGGF